MAGIFKTLGNSLAAVDTLAASGSRRLAVWAREQESQTKYRHVARMTAIKTDASAELKGELDRFNESVKDPAFKAAYDMLTALDQAEAAANK